MKFNLTIEAPEIHLKGFCEITSPYGKIKYRKKGKIYLFYYKNKLVKSFKSHRKVRKFIRAFIESRLIETHEKGLNL